MFKNKINVWVSFLGLLLIPFWAIADDVSIQSVSHGMQALRNMGFGIACFFVDCLIGAFVFLYFFNLEYNKAFWQMFKMKLWAVLYWFCLMIPVGFIFYLMTLLSPDARTFLVDLNSSSWSSIVHSPKMLLVWLCFTLLGYIVSCYIYCYAYRHHVNPSVNQATLRKAVLVLILLQHLINIVIYSRIIALINPLKA